MLNKFNARAMRDEQGRFFASQREYSRWLELKLLERAGEISDLIRQPRYVLQERFADMDGVQIGAITYKPDFQYAVCGQLCVEDVKSPATARRADYRIRVKLFKKRYPHIRFVESE
jgi:hypothetical protein